MIKWLTDNVHFLYRTKAEELQQLLLADNKQLPVRNSMNYKFAEKKIEKYANE